MLNSYAPRGEMGLGRLSTGFAVALALYGGLGLSLWKLSQGGEVLLADSEPAEIIFQTPRPAPPAPPKLGGGSGASAAAARPREDRPRSVAPKAMPNPVDPAAATEDQPSAAAAGATTDIPGDFGDGPGGPGVPWGVPDGCVDCPDTGTGDGKGAGGEEKKPRLLDQSMDAPVRIAELCPQPEYPAAAREAGLNGAVILRITLSEDGKVTAAEVVDGPAIFQEPALAAVKQWRYRPAKFNGEPLAVTMMVTVNFSLR